MYKAIMPTIAHNCNAFNGLHVCCGCGSGTQHSHATGIPARCGKQAQERTHTGMAKQDQRNTNSQQTFDDYVTANWPPPIPEECTELDAGGDCIERDLPKDKYCQSCVVFARLAEEWEKKNPCPK